jgi:tRNA(fMet)-specific endonuclease VapC
VKLLDTDVCILFLTGRDEEVRERLLGAATGELVLCSVVKAELLFGARNSARVDENLQTVERFCEPFESVPFDDAAAAHYGVLRTQLQRAGTPIGGNDMMIAAICLARGLTLVTRNLREFRRVAGLPVQRW